MKKALAGFQRITSSGNYIPEIDGLRFIAIITVIMFHVRGAFVAFTGKHSLYTENLTGSGFDIFLVNGRQGVEIFFAISGFILALPFIKQHRYKEKEVKLSSFYMRRLTRLEPPYILALIILFFGVLLNGEYSFNQLFPSLMASLIYMHNVIFGELPRVTTVAWSLEVEVQFYLLTPLLMRMFLLSKSFSRFILVICIIGFPLLQNIFSTDINSLYKFFQFFATGILFADLYLDKNSIIYKLDGPIFAFLGIIAFLLLFGIDGHVSATLPSRVSWDVFITKIIYPFLILIFFMIVMGNSWWKKIMSINIITIIGAMCYSIYLFHTSIISIFGKYLFSLVLTGNVFADYCISFLLLLIIIVAISACFFRLVERPCMERNWYKNISLRKYRLSLSNKYTNAGND